MVKHGIAIADTHCGSKVGLTPNPWQITPRRGGFTKRNKWARVQADLWQEFTSILKQLPKLDFVFSLGDLIDGKAKRSGGTELITADIQEQCDMAVEVFETIRKHCKKTVKIIGVFGCLTPGHRVLTANLRWVNVETLKAGDKLLAFTEDRNPQTKRRYFREATVISNKTLKKKCYKIHLSDGTSITASEDHAFIWKKNKHLEWVTVKEIVERRQFCKIHKMKWDNEFTRYLPTWATDDTRSGGYLAGFFDGEGSFNISKKRMRNGWKEHVFRVCGYQKENEMLSKVETYLNEHKIKYYVANTPQRTCMQVVIMGGYQKTLEFMGKFRPHRLLAKLDISKMGSVKNRRNERTYITSIEDVGVQTVCGLGTSTKTYIAEGFLCHNTDYHTATEGEDWENEIAHKAGFTKIGAHEWPSVNGCVFDLKHKVSNSQIPHGRYTAVAREKLWNTLWAERDEQPKSNILIRAHAHHYNAIADSDGVAMIMPALQGMGSRYGSREMSGTVDWGLVYFRIEDSGDYDWFPHIHRITAQKAQIVEV